MGPNFRKILAAVLFLGVVIAALLWFYQGFEKSNSRLADAMRAVPAQAAIVFETDDAADIWRDLSQTNLIWEELQATDLYFRLDQVAHAIDSAVRNQDDLRGYLARKPVAISVHNAGTRSYDYLLSLQLNGGVTRAEMIEGITGLLKPKEPLKTKTYDGVEVSEITSSFLDRPVFFYIHEGLLVMSFSNLILEESVRALTRQSSVLDTPAFMAVRNTRGNDARGYLYVNYKELRTIISRYASEDERNHAFFNQSFAGWSALDLSLKSNAVVMNGFIQGSDSAHTWLGTFRELAAPRMNLLAYMPVGTAYFAFFGYGNFAQYRRQQLAFRAWNTDRFSIDETTKRYDARCGCDSEKSGLSWIGSQAAAFITEPATEDYAQNQFAVFATSAPAEAWENVLKLDTLPDTEVNSEVEIYRDLPIHRLAIGNFYGEMLGEAFAGIVDPYVVQYDDVIVMARSLNGLRTLINALIAGRTLAEDKGFAMLGNQISGESNLLIYSALARSASIYAHLLDAPYAAEIAAQADLLRNFQAFIFQVGHYKGDLFYNNLYFRHNPEYKQETSSLWEIALGKPISRKPHLLTNHYTSALEILLQDDSNRVYLIGNTGKILWDLDLDGAITGEVQQVDVYRNSKLQILFSTPTSVYLIDRNGNNVESFPIRLPSEATAGVSVVDYENNRDYRFFIPITGGSILAFDKFGKAVDGWKFEGHPSEIINPVAHLRVKSRDYLFALAKDGEVLLLDRQGKARHEVSKRAVGLFAKGYSVEAGNNAIAEGGLFYLDTLSAPNRLGFGGNMENYDLFFPKPLDCEFKDFNGDGKTDVAVLMADKLAVYQLDGSKIFEVDLSEEGYDKLQYFRFPEGDIALGLSGKEASKIALYHADGTIYKGFPLYGSLPFAIGDMNRDGYFNLITGTRDGYIYAYAIE